MRVFSGHPVTLVTSRLSQLLQDSVCVCSEVQIFLEEIPAPVGENFLGRLSLLVLDEQGITRLVIVAGAETAGDDALLDREVATPQTEGDAGTSPEAAELSAEAVTSLLWAFLLLRLVEESHARRLE